jgi:arylmalonate decarboxylase
MSAIHLQPRRTVGLVIPFTSVVQTFLDLAHFLYPDLRFIGYSVDVKNVSHEGFKDSWDRIVPTARQLVAEGAEAVMVIGTSLTFHRGPEAHEKLLEELRGIGVPIGTMSTAIVEGLRQFGVHEIGVATAYGEDINAPLRDYLVHCGFRVLALEGFGGANTASSKTDQDICDISRRVLREAGGAEGLLVSCGGLRTLTAAPKIEEEHGLPVVCSTESSLWAAARLAGHSGRSLGHGRLLAS